MSEPRVRHVVAVGVFDGVHRGHQRILEVARATARERGVDLAVVTFEPHPDAVLGKALPKPPLTPDQVELLKTDNVVSPEAQRENRTLEALGVDPTAMQMVVPSYLWRFRKTGQFRVRGA